MGCSASTPESYKLMINDPKVNPPLGSAEMLKISQMPQDKKEQCTLYFIENDKDKSGETRFEFIILS